MALKSADNYRTLRKQGITIRKTADVIIASFCIENNLPLLFSDKDFIPSFNRRIAIALLPGYQPKLKKILQQNEFQFAIHHYDD